MIGFEYSTTLSMLCVKGFDPKISCLLVGNYDHPMMISENCSMVMTGKTCTVFFLWDFSTIFFYISFLKCHYKAVRFFHLPASNTRYTRLQDPISHGDLLISIYI